MLFLFWLCPLAIGCLLGKEILTLWLGSSFADQGWRLFQVVIGGVCLNGLAHLAVAMLHADGRSDLTAKFHVGELLPYGILVVLLVERYGVLGAAIAWSLRVMADFLLLCLAVGIRRIVGWDDLAKLVVPSVSMVAAVLIIGGADSWMARLAISIVVALVGLLMLARMFALSRPMWKGR
jgi:O-antigen/teichoic acid export membrane protein